MSEEDAGDGIKDALDGVLSRFDKLEARVGTVVNAIDNIGKQQEQRETQDAQARAAQQTRQIEQRANQTALAVDARQAAMEKAFESEDPKAIAKAQRELSEAIALRDRTAMALANHKAALKQRAAEEKTAAADGGGGSDEGQKAQNRENLERWQSKHSSWYGTDAAMTKAAHEIDKEIRDARVIRVGSPEYFEAIDKRMMSKFPDKFDKNADLGASGGGRGGSGGDSQKGGGRIPASVVDGWRRMGINVDDPKVMESMVESQKKLRDKGILAATPQYGSVISR